MVTTWLVNASGSDDSVAMPARWTTPSSGPASAKTAITASTSAQSAVCQSPSYPSGAGSTSRPTTSWPRSRSPVTTTRPMIRLRR